jgi:hypothetical protein
MGKDVRSEKRSARYEKVPQQKQHEDEKAAVTDAPKSDVEKVEEPKAEQAPGEFEKPAAVLSKLKEMEFYSRANIETLAELTLTIDDELKQKEFSDPVGESLKPTRRLPSAIGRRQPSLSYGEPRVRLPYNLGRGEGRATVAIAPAKGLR